MEFPHTVAYMRIFLPPTLDLCAARRRYAVAGICRRARMEQGHDPLFPFPGHPAGDGARLLLRLLLLRLSIRRLRRSRGTFPQLDRRPATAPQGTATDVCARRAPLQQNSNSFLLTVAVLIFFTATTRARIITPYPLFSLCRLLRFRRRCTSTLLLLSLVARAAGFIFNLLRF